MLKVVVYLGSKFTGEIGFFPFSLGFILLFGKLGDKLLLVKKLTFSKFSPDPVGEVCISSTFII